MVAKKDPLNIKQVLMPFQMLITKAALIEILVKAHAIFQNCNKV